jgi:uncharacterized RDD family membrane protein YckC
MTADELATVVRAVLASEAASRAWDEVLDSSEVQRLVERIAEAPEVRAAITAQGAGLITDIGVRLAHITEALDDKIERIVRRRDPDSETNQAGLATRSVAAAVDLGLLFAGYSLLSSVVSSVLPYVFGGHLSLAVAVILGTLGFATGGAIFAAFWALAGRTPGMHLLQIRLIHEGSREIGVRCAIRRLFGLLLALAPAGIGFLAIARDPLRRGWHDRLAGTEVIYDSVRRAAYRTGGAIHETVSERTG